MKCQMCKALIPFPGVSIPLPSSMRLIRSQLLPNHNHGLRKLLHPLVGEVCEGHGSAGISRHRCGRFFSTVTAVASSDDAQSIQRGYKRLPKHERRIMVESFVNEYRSLNAGKFPTISAAQKEVGGSYYVIREIIQDLEYNFVHNPGVGMPGKSLVEKKASDDIIIPKREDSRDQEVSCSHSRGDSHLPEVEKDPHADAKLFTRDMQAFSDNVEIGVEKTADLKVERELAGSEEVDGPPLSGTIAGDVSTISQRMTCEEPERVTFIEHADHLSGDGINKDTTSPSERPSMEDVENPRSKEDADEFLTRSTSVEAEGSSSRPLGGKPVLVDDKDAMSVQGLVKPDISTSNTNDDQITPNSDLSRETSTEKSKDDDTQVNPSIWANLKSCADSIFSIWRKR